MSNPSATKPTNPCLEIIGETDVELWSLSAAERHRRAFARAGVDLETPAKAVDCSMILVRADYFLSSDLVSALINRPGVVLSSVDGNVAVAAHIDAADRAQATAMLRSDSIDEFRDSPAIQILGPEELGSKYDTVLRKKANPVVLSYAETSIDELESITFGAAYKGATDFVTKWIWPRPARWATRWAAARGISPNSVTTMSLVLVILATWLFYEGHFLIGIPIAWAMTFLDTVDGKLARVTLTSSPWGNVYDHGIDLIHPPFWWWAWYVGVQTQSAPNVLPLLEPALKIIIVGYIVGRLLELSFVLAFKLQTHIWRPIDYFFRTITARRNPNLAILMVATLVSRPDLGFIAVAGWTVISLVFHFVRLMQATIKRLNNQEIVSFLRPVE